jgi:chromosome segregation ATPase
MTLPPEPNGNKYTLIDKAELADLRSKLAAAEQRIRELEAKVREYIECNSQALREMTAWKDKAESAERRAEELEHQADIMRADNHALGARIAAALAVPELPDDSDIADSWLRDYYRKAIGAISQMRAELTGEKK